MMKDGFNFLLYHLITYLKSPLISVVEVHKEANKFFKAISSRLLSESVMFKRGEKISAQSSTKINFFAKLKFYLRHPFI